MGGGSPENDLVAFSSRIIDLIWTMTDFVKPNPIWKLALQVSVVEAALLLIDIEPQGVSSAIENWSDDNKPNGYLAAREAIVSGLRHKTIDGDIRYREYRDEHGNYEVDQDSVEYHTSRVTLFDLQIWLKGRRYFEGFLMESDERTAGFRDKKHPRYSAKLAAVVEAWEAYDEESNEAGRPKQRLAKWLRLNAGRFGLTNDEGLPSETVVDALAKVANWGTSGGAPKQLGVESEPDN